jgi:crotonobetainyl-CoA:carnitine CoA-transferase CaiB-like acyl-CoA transferase
MSALRGIRVVELAGRVAGEYCGKLLSDFGAEVIKVEPAGGSPTRAMAPLVEGRDGGKASGLFAYLNTNKKSVALDPAQARDRALLHELVASADAVIDDQGEAWLEGLGLGAKGRADSFPGVVFCSITPFGGDAPEGWDAAKSLNVFHMSGWGYHTPSAPDPAKPPLKGPGRFSVDYEAAMDAAMCVLSSVYRRGRTGEGEFIEVSEREVLLARADTVVGRLLAGDDEPGHSRGAYDQRGPQQTFATADGYVYLYIVNEKHWRGLRELMGQPAWMNDFEDRWLEFGVTEERVATFRAHFAEWVRPFKKDPISEEAQKLGVPLVPVNDASDLHRSPQFQHRGYFQPLTHPELGEKLYPTVGYKLSATPAKLTDAAPGLNQDAAALENLARPAAPAVRKESMVAPAARRGGPLAGVRVLELTKVWAGPYAGKILAFLGAEVIKVESMSNLDEMRAYGGVDINRAPYFLSLNPEVLSVQVNMKSEAGIRYIKEMVAKSDIVLNNLRPGAMERSGLGYEDLKKIRSDIISVSIKMFGNDGPLGYQTGYAPCFAALSGMNYLVGYENGPPLAANMRYGDSCAGNAAAFAAIAALMHRERTGEGQFADVSAVEALSSLVGDSLFEYNLTGRVPGPDGNRHSEMAPHGCYPCESDEWLSLAVASEAEWRTLCAVLGDAALADDPRFATLAARQANLAALDERLSKLTRPHVAAALAERLREDGIGAFKSLNALDLVSDDELWRRGIFKLVSDAAQGSRPIVGAPWRFSRAPFALSRGAPVLGEHNRYVYCDVLGLSPEAFEKLVAEGVVD